MILVGSGVCWKKWRFGVSDEPYLWEVSWLLLGIGSVTYTTYFGLERWYVVGYALFHLILTHLVVVMESDTTLFFYYSFVYFTVCFTQISSLRCMTDVTFITINLN